MEGGANHRSSPFVYKNKDEYLGGCDSLYNYLKQNYPESETVKEYSKFY